MTKKEGSKAVGVATVTGAIPGEPVENAIEPDQKNPGQVHTVSTTTPQTIKLLERKFGRIAMGSESYAVGLSEIEFDGVKKESFVTHSVNGRHYVQPEGITARAYNQLDTVGIVDGLTIPAGVCLVIGETSAGKTPFVKYLASKLDVPVIRFGEPLPGYMREDRELAMTMLLSKSKVLVIDSLKNLVTRLAGGLFATGLSREFFMAMSDWSSYFAEQGRAVITPLNIATDDAKAVAATMLMARSNTTMVIELDPSGTFTYQTRVNEGMPRQTGTGRIVWNDRSVGGVNRLIVNPSGHREGEDVSLLVRMSIEQPDTMATSVRRLLNRN